MRRPAVRTEWGRRRLRGHHRCRERARRRRPCRGRAGVRRSYARRRRGGRRASQRTAEPLHRDDVPGTVRHVRSSRPLRNESLERFEQLRRVRESLPGKLRLHEPDLRVRGREVRARVSQEAALPQRLRELCRLQQGPRGRVRDQHLHRRNNCGACGNKCADGVQCIDGKCGCDPGYILCADPYAANGKCIDARSDDANCGACGNRCGTPADAGAPPDNMVYGCIDNQCGQLKCKDTGCDKWADCDKNRANGCEVYVGANDSLIDPNNCGKCGKKCAADYSARTRTSTPSRRCLLREAARDAVWKQGLGEPRLLRPPERSRQLRDLLQQVHRLPGQHGGGMSEGSLRARMLAGLGRLRRRTGQRLRDEPQEQRRPLRRLREPL